MISSCIPIFQKHYTRFCTKLRTLVDGDAFDLHPLNLQTTMGIIFEAGFGSEKLDESISASLLENCVDNVWERLKRPYYYPDIFYKMSNLYREDQVIERAATEVFEKIINRRLDYYKTVDKARQTVGEECCKTILLIDGIIQYAEKQGPIFKDVAVQNLFSIFTTGYDTSAITMSSTLILLAMHPDVDKKLEKELQQYYQPGNDIDQNLLSRLTYLDMVVKETLRLIPTVPITLRTSLERTNLRK